MTRLQRAKTSISVLLSPEHKVGDPPGFVQELKNILFGLVRPVVMSIWVYLEF
jgi:hypothetical protein